MVVSAKMMVARQCVATIAAFLMPGFNNSY